MALLASSTTLSGSLISYIQNPNHNSTQFLSIRNPLFLPQRSLRSSAIIVFSVSNGHNPTPTPSSPSLPPLPENLHSNDRLPPRNKTLKLNSALLHFATSAILFVALSARACSAVSGNPPLVPVTTTCYTASVVEERNEEIVDGNNGSSLEQNSVNTENHITGNSITPENVEDKELQAMLESWKSKTYALTVPLRVVALRGSVPPSWIKDFMQSQGKRLNLRSEFRGSLNDIFLDLTSSIGKGNIEPKSAMAADIVTVGDSWLSLGINKGIFEPIQGAEEQDWFKGLSEKWKIYLRRNSNGELDSAGKIWAAPYRWGSMVIAYKKNKFQKHNIAPIEDWGDLWRPELAGKIAMIDSPREVVGAVFKYMGASYNTMDIDSQVTGGKNAAMESLTLLQKQVRLFDSVHYLKAFGVGDVWVAVGWSSDIVPAAKRMSNVAVVVPKSGASLWADLWATPAAPRFATSRIGGRVRGPSPLIHQWIDFCLQAARALPFVQEVVPGASPFALESPPMQKTLDLTKDKPKLDTNLIAGVPPPDILAKCEFLEPLSDAALMDYQWLVSSMRKPSRGFINNMQDYISSMVQNFRLKPQSK